MVDPEKVLQELGKQQEWFVSEKDFQLKFAWKLKELYSNVSIFLEYGECLQSSGEEEMMHIDIMVFDGNEKIPIELKYKTKELFITHGDQKYHIKNHGAKDCGCYDYLRDIQRIERLCMYDDQIHMGYAIMLTNDASYKKQAGLDTNYYAFSIHHGAAKKGKLNWRKGTCEGTTKGRKKEIFLKGEYEIDWKEYATIENEKYGEFSYLINTCKREELS